MYSESPKSFNIGGIFTCTVNLRRVSVLGEFLHVQWISQEFQYWGNFYMYSESPKSFNIGGIFTCTVNLRWVSILGEFLHVQRISLKSFNIGGISTCTVNLSRVSTLFFYVLIWQFLDQAMPGYLWREVQLLIHCTSCGSHQHGLRRFAVHTGQDCVCQRRDRPLALPGHHKESTSGTGYLHTRSSKFKIQNFLIFGITAVLKNQLV